MFWIIFAPFLMVAAGAGIIYPALAVVFYKIRYRDRITIKAILREIGW